LDDKAIGFPAYRFVAGSDKSTGLSGSFGSFIFSSGVVEVISIDDSPKSCPKHLDFIFLWLIIDITILITETINDTILNISIL